MKPKPSPASPQEIELKLSLCGADPAEWARRLAAMPVLAQLKSQHQSLHNIYFDTPDQQLRQQRVALRLRRVGSARHPQWLQTLKTAGSEASALSRRGEWESAVAGDALDRQALQDTAWDDIDPDGSLFDRLLPCFVTAFERTFWQVSQPDGTQVEVALDLGQIEAGGRQEPLAELELELKSGSIGSLFELACELASSLAVLPANQSKSQRGYRLAQAQPEQPQHALAPKLKPPLALPELAQRVLRESFAQFSHNLNLLRLSDDPEAVHQARIGWRRFRSAARLFRNLPGLAAVPSGHELRAMLGVLGELRNLDVALTETLPRLQASFCAADAKRADSWQAMLAALAEATAQQRQALRQRLDAPGVGRQLLLITEWLENLGAVEQDRPLRKAALSDWAVKRILRLQQRLDGARKVASTPAQKHRVRILAKRLRYGVEALRDLLPGRLAERCHAQALGMQTSAGLRQDLAQAGARVAQLEVDPAIVGYLRGVAEGAAITETLTAAESVKAR